MQVLYRRPAHSSPHTLCHCTNTPRFWGNIIAEELVSCNEWKAMQLPRSNYMYYLIWRHQRHFPTTLPLSLVHTTSINSRAVTVNRFYLSFSSPYLHWRIVVHTMEHSPSSEAKRRSGNQIFICLLQNPNFHHGVQKRLLLDSIRSEINAVHTVITLLGLYFGTVLVGSSHLNWVIIV
jgi:hypothetical protein